MFVVITTVEVEAGSIDELAATFDRTNRDLVDGHDDWLAAYFTADRDASTVTVIAHWKRVESYEALRSSDEFQQVMSQFAPHFVTAPTVAVNEVLVHM